MSGLPGVLQPVWPANASEVQGEELKQRNGSNGSIAECFRQLSVEALLGPIGDRGGSLSPAAHVFRGCEMNQNFEVLFGVPKSHGEPLGK